MRAGSNGGSGNTWKARKVSAGSLGGDDDVDMGGGGNGAGGSGSPRVGYGTPSRTNPRELGAKFWKTPDVMFENKEGHNKGEGEGSNPKPQKKGVQNKCRLWIKGYERKLTKAGLKAQSDFVLGCANAGLSDEESFSPKQLIFNSEMASSFVFETGEDAEAFLGRHRDGRESVKWVDPLGGHSEGVRVLRVEGDATFDQRLRGRVYFHLKQHTTCLLSSKVRWGTNMKVDNSGPRGVVFCTTGDETWELFQVRFAHCGGGEFLEPKEL